MACRRLFRRTMMGEYRCDGIRSPIRVLSKSASRWWAGGTTAVGQNSRKDYTMAVLPHGYKVKHTRT